MTEPIRVLIVDDDEDDYIIIKDLLSQDHSCGYVTSWAKCIAEGLSALATRNFDICLCDYRLGAENGIHFLQKVQSIPGNIPVILLTGMDAADVDIEAIRAGASDYLDKNHLKVDSLVRSIRYSRERIKILEELFREKERLQVTLESIGEAVIATDRSKIIIHINRTGEELTGYSFAEAVGRPFSEIIRLYNENTGLPVLDPLDQAAIAGAIVRFDDNFIATNQHERTFACEATVSPIHDRENILIGTIVVFRDVSSTRELTKKISYQAAHDGLTGLLNRASFETVLSQALSDSIESKNTQRERDVLLYLDLDGFKIVNDTCGHIAGDQLLRELPELLRRTIRKTDVCARLGGDEFGILLYSCFPDKGFSIATQICENIKNYRFKWLDRVFIVGVSIGMAEVSPLESGTVDSLMNKADEACYAAKKKGGNSILVAQTHGKETGVTGERSMALVLNSCLQRDDIVLYGQPILDISGKANNRTEILARIRDDDGTLIFPGSFIPAAERYKLSTVLDRKVIELSFQFCRKHALSGNKTIFNINLTSATMNDEKFPNFLEEEIKKYEIDARMLCFEIMETTAIDYFKSTIDFINRIRRLGCQFAIDDFGSGVTTFNYLKLLPVEFIKIDRSFIEGCTQSEVDLAIVESVHRISRLLKVQTIAEGIETPDTLEKIRSIGIGYVQGYYLAKPVPLA
ncbi:MAG: EAL domain-containing protein [Spirochaetaceae bacterium]|nr:MAG: EAL domain-containing protein [Spirochaetaceae bacterium]